jgi:hypothetical protein
MKANLTQKQVNEIRNKYKNGVYTQYNLGLEYGISQDNISRIINFKYYKSC